MRLRAVMDVLAAFDLRPPVNAGWESRRGEEVAGLGMFASTVQRVLGNSSMRIV